MNTIKRFGIPIAGALVIFILGFALAASTLGDDQGEAQDPVEQDASLKAGGATGDGSELVAYQPQVAPFTINVTVDDNGVVGDTIFIPKGQQVKLIFRNRSSEEHHFHVVGMPVSDMLWMTTADQAEHEGHEAEAADMPDMTEDEHAQHHSSVAFVDHHVCNSETGICPIGDWVHAHANPGMLDVILFTAMEEGTYQVECPLHESIHATVAVI